ncbi:MAG: sensor histidine kinase KdpD [Alphaproteobacteria bacterium]|nr:sensor histidine kinase KdpD [Alphaproteobacteria bacterium]
MTVPIDPPIVGPSTRLFPKGHLKIFLGASPGVGKTFSMLQAGSERQSEGVDVVVGLVETHKRKETEEQLANLEILPRKKLNYRGRTFEELDLDGILARAPQLVLIDECAHSNLPGSRHPKRYDDITEILEHGIDVYTTLNIQHFESLKDIIEQMTRITIRETVPDSFTQSADEVQLIDLPPNDLLQRLSDGKIYIPEQAKTAIDHFFTRSNLLNLRELALRQTITVADEKVTQDVQQRGIKGSWPTSDKVMVCVSTDLSSAYLIRTARRIADRLHAKLVAVTIETSDDENRSLIAQQQLSQNLHLAEELGAEVVALDGTDVAETLVQYALTNNVTDILVGQASQGKEWEKIPVIGPLLVSKSTAEKILSYRPSLTLRVIPTEQNGPIPHNKSFTKSPLKPFLPYISSLFITLGMLAAAGQITKYTKITDVSTFLFLSVLWVSIKFGLRPAVLATIIGSLVYDYTYIDPLRNVGMDTLGGWIVFVSFVFASIVISNLAIHSQNVFKASQGRLRQIRFFSNFTTQLTRHRAKEQILSYLCKELHQFLNISVIAFWEIHDKFTPAHRFPKTKNPELTPVDESAIQWALAHQSRSGRSTKNFSDARYLYLPIKIGKNSLGVVGIRALKGQLTIDDLRMAQTLIDQAALAIDRLNYVSKPKKKEK